MGGLVFSFFAALYYWFPKMFGVHLNEKLGKLQFWMFFIFFNLTFFPMFAIGLLGQPRRYSAYPPSLQWLNDWATAAAYMLGLSFAVFLYNVFYSCFVGRRATAQNPWRSRSIEWQLPTPIPVDNFDRIPVITAAPYDYGVPDAAPVANLRPTGAEVVAAGG